MMLWRGQHLIALSYNRANAADNFPAVSEFVVNEFLELDWGIGGDELV